VYGTLIEGLARQRPRAIVFDILLVDPHKDHAADDLYLIRAAHAAGNVFFPLVRLPGGAVDARPSPTDYLTDPQVLVYAGLTAVGLAILARSGNSLPLLVVLSALLVFPAFNARHDILPRQGRYLAPLLPLLFTALASAACTTGAAVGRWLDGCSYTTRKGRLLGFAAAALLIAAPLLPLQRYYADSVASGETNERFFRLLAKIESSRTNDELIVLDNQLEQEHLGGGGTAIQTMDFLLTTRGVPHQEITVDPDRLVRRFGGGRVILVLGEKTYRNQAATLALAPPPGQQTILPPDPYGVYVLAPATAER
jgi:hypothetical protein